jgi:hypothetical protein
MTAGERGTKSKRAMRVQRVFEHDSRSQELAWWTVKPGGKDECVEEYEKRSRKPLRSLCSVHYRYLSSSLSRTQLEIFGIGPFLESDTNPNLLIFYVVRAVQKRSRCGGKGMTAAKGCAK